MTASLQALAMLVAPFAWLILIRTATLAAYRRIERSRVG